MCCETQLAPIKQMLQVGDIKTMRRGFPAAALKAEVNCRTERRSVSWLDIDGPRSDEWAGDRLLALPQPASPSASSIGVRARARLTRSRASDLWIGAASKAREP